MAKKATGLSEELREAINEAARAGAFEAAAIGTGAYVNHYKSMEKLLYNYKNLAAIVADEEVYCEVEYHAGRKSFEAMPQAKGYYQKPSEEEITEDMREEKRRQYEKTKFGFERLNRVIHKHENRKEFAIVRMYYFGENIDGTQAESGKTYTWEQVAEACEAAGLLKEIKTARRWRNRIVNDMAVCMFGVPAAISAGVYRQTVNDQIATTT